MTGSSPALSLAHLSLIACPPDQLVMLAAQAGFGLVDLRLSPATPTDRVYGDDERMQLCRALLPLLRRTGMKVWDVEIIRLKERTRPEDHLPLMEAARLLGARRIKTVCDCEDPVLAAGLLARLADLAAPVGLTVDLEYMIFSGVKSLRAALAIVEAAARPNLQVLVDALHWMRAGDTVADILAAPPGRIGYVQLCDGPALGPSGREALIAEARTRRLPPGEGEFPLRALLEAMPPGCPVSIEVPLPGGGDALRHARRLFTAAQSVMQRQEAAP
jgi:sugar phosphate isomerase/epimerase